MNIEIPEFLKHLKVDERGYPIPFFVPIKNGRPEFKFMDQNKLELATNKHLCHICGKKLHKDFHYFISGPMGFKNQVSSDAAMHRNCAEYALQVCPHILYQKAERKEKLPPGVKSPVMDEKAECILLIKSSGYKAKFHPEFGYRLIHYKAVSAEKYIYVDNKLQKA